MADGFCSCGMRHAPCGAPARAPDDATQEMLLSEVGGGGGGEKPLRFDLHSHILPKQWPSLSEKYGEGPWIQMEHTRDGFANMTRNGKFFREVGKNCWDSETRILESDRYGIDVQVLSTVPVMFSYWAKPEHTLDLSRYLNDNIAQVGRLVLLLSPVGGRGGGRGVV